MPAYEAVDVYWVISGERAIFWPVMRRPGRQRVTRLAFMHPGDAAIYGLRLQNRYEAIWNKNPENY
jgi:hypothetical protein